MPKPYMFQVFVNENGQYGNPGSLIIDETCELNSAERIAITADIGHDETVFVNDLHDNDVSIYHSQGEVNFAGSVLIGTIWQLKQIKSEPTKNIHCPVGDVNTWEENGIFWLQANLDGNLGDWNYEQLASPSEVDAIKVEDTVGWKKMVWAYTDEPKGLIRARTFASKIDIPEVQGNGSGTMNLAGQLKKEVQILHGDGSVIYARPADDNFAILGGRVSAI